ncbi:MAG: glycosyltransferase [Betaproteobacteria bacterium]|nr:MAG: glycosyltransferase [Betaproteobacteria bacterium]
MIEVLVIAFHPDAQQFQALANSLIQASASGVPLHLRVWHNDGGAPVAGDVFAMYEGARAQGLRVSAQGGEGNLGFGPGINRLLAHSSSEFVLVLNQDAIPEAGALELLSAMARSDPPDIAAWEMRQIPFEHPKLYDPVSLDTEWFSAAAVLLRTQAMQKVGGFEPRIFMYGEDVDLSWRLRCAGFRLKYVPRAAVVHHTYSKPDEVKPLQALQGIYANLCLRARYSGHKQILSGLAMAGAEMLLPQSFPGRRVGIAKAILKFGRNYRYFWRSRVSAPNFEPRFAGWGYEIRRDGAFHPFTPRDQQPSDAPLVSVLIRTHKRAAFLRQALQSVAGQTHRPIEVIVVEDGSDEAQPVCQEFSDRLNVRYFRVDPARGRSAAGNLALEQATGAWLCFLDDDDLFFADHLEVLLQTVRETQLKGAYALAWRTTTKLIDADTASYEEIRWERIPDEPFSRVTMWHHNFMPIQAVLFHRSLYEANGGFAEDMDQLEDWNLWTRYTLRDDFVQVRKTTSKYRVPAETIETAERQAKLDRAYQDAVARQSQMKFESSPELIRALAQDYARSNSLINISRDQLRATVSRSSALSTLASWRYILKRRL